MTCYSREELEAYAHGRASPEALPAISTHLETCAQCEATVSAFEKEGDTIIKQLRQASAKNEFAAEAECKQALERLKSTRVAGARDVAPTVTAAGAAAAAAASDPPRQIREYRLLKKLGEGGMGAVYKALHTKLDKLVAIKVLLPGAVGDPERIARFEQEMKAIGKLEHPNIVRAMDAGQVGDRHFLVMEYVEGIDLAALVRRSGPLRIADACELVRQATLGLRAADEHGLVHRDIKPSNLILNAEGQVKILDLGLATFQTAGSDGDTTDSGRVVGTPDYMAPEQAAGESVDIRADIYSLGCTLYKLLTGDAPFAGPKYKGKLAKLTAHVSAPVPPINQQRKDVPAKLAAAVHRMLAKDRAARFATPRQLAEELHPYCAGADLAGLFARVAEGQAVARAERSEARQDQPAGQTGVRKPETGTRAQDVSPRPRAASGTMGEGQGMRASQPQAVTPSPKGVSAPDFDPYYKWLGIPPEEQPANHYRLLGLRLFEADREVIQAAVDRQTVHLRTFALGKRQALSQKLLNHVHEAKICLLTPEKKALYDAELRWQVTGEKGQVSGETTPASPGRKPAEVREESPPAAAMAIPLPAPARSRISPRVMAVACAAGIIAVILLSVVLILRNRQGEELARVTVPDGSKVAVAGDGHVTVTVPQDAVRQKAPASRGQPETGDQAAERLQRALQRLWLERLPVDEQFFWCDHSINCLPEADGSRALVVGFSEMSRLWPQVRATVEEVERLPQKARCQTQGPIALVHCPLVRFRQAGPWQTCENLMIAARQAGTWRIAAEVSGKWGLGENDRFDPANEEHRQVQALFDKEDQLYRERNPALLDQIHHTLYRGVMPGAAAPASAAFSTNEEVLAAVAEVLRDPEPQRHYTTIKWIKVQGPLALAIRDTKHVWEGKREDRGLGLAICCRTPDGWRIAIQVAGDWSDLLLHRRTEPLEMPAALPQQAQTTPARIPRKSPGRWLGYTVHSPPGPSASQAIQPLNLIVDTSWTTGSEEWLDLARRQGKRVILALEGDYVRLVRERAVALARANSDVVIAIYLISANANGCARETISALGQDVKRALPGVEFWVGFPFWPKPWRGTSLPPEIDIIVLEMHGAGTPSLVATSAETAAAELKRRAKGRPILLWWTAWQKEPPGLFPVCESGTFAACARAVERFGLAGLVIDSYGPRPMPKAERKVGIETRPDLISEVERIAQVWDEETLGAADGAPGGAEKAPEASSGPPHPTSTPQSTTPPLAIAPFDEKKAKEHQQNWAKHLGVPVEMTNSIGMRFVLIPPGEFEMGSPDSEGPVLPNEKPQHHVRITRPFYLGKYEVTQAEWESVMKSNPSQKKGPSNPVHGIAWDECQVFLDKLNAKRGSREERFRLPTEAEWEYACRAGSTTRYSFGDTEAELREYAWYEDNSEGRQLRPVGQKRPNAFGLYDMHGSVFECCADGWDVEFYANSPIDDPLRPADAGVGTARGGSFYGPAKYCRSASRVFRNSGSRQGNLGLRLCQTIAPTATAGLPNSVSPSPISSP